MEWTAERETVLDGTVAPNSNLETVKVSRRTAVIAGILVSGVGGLIWGVVFLSLPREPTYQGKTLSEWIAPFCRQTAKGLDAGGPEHIQELEPVREAVREMGSNAVPFLIARLNHRESALHRTTRQLLQKQPIAGLRLTDPNVSKVRAIRALAILGPAARPAISSLAAQLTDTTLSEHALYVLIGMGVEGMRAIIKQYANVPVAVRTQIALIITSYEPGYQQEYRTHIYSEKDEAVAECVIEGLSRVAQDRPMGFRAVAIQRLGEYGARASNAVPILTQVLNEHDSVTLKWAIRSLGEIRSQPEVVVPALTSLLNDPDPVTQLAAVSALHAFEYDGQIQPPAPVLQH